MERKPWLQPLLRPPLKKAEGDQNPTAVRTARRLSHHMVSLSFSSHLITVCRSARPRGVTLNEFQALALSSQPGGGDGGGGGRSKY